MHTEKKEEVHLRLYIKSISHSVQSQSFRVFFYIFIYILLVGNQSLLGNRSPGHKNENRRKVPSCHSFYTFVHYFLRAAAFPHRDFVMECKRGAIESQSHLSEENLRKEGRKTAKSRLRISSDPPLVCEEHRQRSGNMRVCFWTHVCCRVGEGTRLSVVCG